MVILRIWPPPPSDRHSIGFASLEVSGTYISVRPVKPEVAFTRRIKTATLADDIEGDALDTPPTWVYTRLNESVMVRTWERFKGDVRPTGMVMRLPVTTVFASVTCCSLPGVAWP